MKRRPLCLLCLTVIVLIAILKAAGLPLTPLSPGERRLAAEQGEAVSCQLIGCVSESRTGDNYTTLILSRTTLVLNSEDFSISPVKLSTDQAAPPGPGEWIRASGQLTEIEGPENPGQFDQRTWYLAKKVRFEMKSPEISRLPAAPDLLLSRSASLRSALLKRIKDLYPSREAGIVSALILGEKTLLDEDTRSLFKHGGIMHILAISGLHITACGMLCYRLLSSLAAYIVFRAGALLSARRKRRQKEPPSFPRRTIFTDPAGTSAAVLTVAAMVLYCFFTGGAVSSVRAVIMFALIMGARVTGRTYDALTALACAGLLLLLDNPCYIAYSGFQMSFAAVLVCSIFRRRGKLLILLFLNLYMLPLILLNEYEMPLLGPLVNLAAVPLLPILLAASLFGLAGSFFLPGAAASFPALVLLGLLNALLEAVDRLPFATIVLGRPEPFMLVLYYILLILWTLAYLKKRLSPRRFPLLALLPLLILLLGLQNPFHHMRVVFLSVGQGDACLCETPSGDAFLVDGGSTTIRSPGSRLILPCIKSRGIRHLDYIFATHMDEDHINGIREMLEEMAEGMASLTAGTLVMPYLAAPDDAFREMAALARRAGMRVITAKSGDSFAFGAVRVIVLNPDPLLEETPPDANAQCLALIVSYGEFDMLLTGDITGEGEVHLEKVLSSAGKQAEVLKVAHHGSRYSTPESFLEAVRPAVSIISCGRKNRYGHPHDELIARLEMSGTQILRTDRQGAVLIETNGTWYSASVPYE